MKVNSLRWSIFWIVLLLYILPAAGQEWYAFQEGMKLAQAHEKHIIIDFYAEWCTWCKVMEKKTFSDTEVQNYLFKNFIPIKLNAESTTEEIEFQGRKYTPRELTRAFQVSGFPSVAFLTPQVEVIALIPGYIEKEMFMNLLQYMERECYLSQTSFDEFLEKECDNRTPE